MAGHALLLEFSNIYIKYIYNNEENLTLNNFFYKYKLFMTDLNQFLQKREHSVPSKFKNSQKVYLIKTYGRTCPSLKISNIFIKYIFSNVENLTLNNFSTNIFWS